MCVIYFNIVAIIRPRKFKRPPRKVIFSLLFECVTMYDVINTKLSMIIPSSEPAPQGAIKTLVHPGLVNQQGVQLNQPQAMSETR